MVETRINSATSATVRNRAFAWDSTLASLLRACWHCTPLWLLWPVSTVQSVVGGRVDRIAPHRTANRWRHLAVAELLGALGGFPDCLDESAADAARLQRPQAGGGGAARGGDGGPMLFGGLAGLGEQTGRAEHGLADQRRRRRPRPA